jgi:hypothetical protein
LVATGGGGWSATNASRNSAAGRHQPSILLPGCHVIQQERPQPLPGMPTPAPGSLRAAAGHSRARSRPSGHGPLPSPYIGRHGGACCLRAERMAGGVSAARASARSDRRLPQVTSRRTQPILNTAWPARGHRTALPYRSALQASVGHRVCVEAATCQVVRSWAGKGLPLPGCWSMMPIKQAPKRGGDDG